MDLVDRLRSQLGDYGRSLQDHVVMTDKICYGLAGVSEYYLPATTTPGVVKAIQAAHSLGLPWLILGAGQRVVFSEIGFNGLVIHNLTRTVAFDPNQAQVVCDSGVMIPRLIMEAISRDKGGLEFLAGMRGTLGGALWFSASQFGFQLASLVKRITVCFPDGTVESHPMSWFRFGRHNHKFFRNSSESGVFLSSTLQLHTAKKFELLRRVQFYRQRLGELADDPTIVSPLFHAPEYPGDLTPILAGLGGQNFQTRFARLVPSANTAKLRRCTSHQLRDWLETIKGAVHQSTGIMLEELFSYVGQW